jgi:hypothetical protein
MRTSCVKNDLVVGVILLFVGVAVQPSMGLSNNDDTTPPVTTYTLDPPEPDGLNGWYVSDVTVTLNATDDVSGVKEIRYTINGWEEVIEGSIGQFVLTNDGEDICIEYWAIDNAGNVEPKNTIVPLLDMDQSNPVVEFYYDIFDLKPLLGWYYIFTMNASDAMSRMNRVEFYINDVLKETVTGPGWSYKWEFRHPYVFIVIGLICNREITNEYVKFYALIVLVLVSENILDYSACAYDNAGNMAKQVIKHPCSPNNYPQNIYKYQQLGFPNDYGGYIGRYFIIALF